MLAPTNISPHTEWAPSGQWGGLALKSSANQTHFARTNICEPGPPYSACSFSIDFTYFACQWPIVQLKWTKQTCWASSWSLHILLFQMKASPPCNESERKCSKLEGLVHHVTETKICQKCIERNTERLTVLQHHQIQFWYYCKFPLIAPSLCTVMDFHFGGNL